METDLSPGCFGVNVETATAGQMWKGKSHWLFGKHPPAAPAQEVAVGGGRGAQASRCEILEWGQSDHGGFQNSSDETQQNPPS